jgi:WD40 repeat protein
MQEGDVVEVGWVVKVNFNRSGKVIRNSHLYSGKVTHVNADGTFKIAYDDGDKEDSVQREWVQWRRLVPAADQLELANEGNAAFSEGQSVMAKCDEWQEHYAGTITKVNGDGTYGVTFEDGDSRRFMQTSQLKLPDGPTSVDTRADTGVTGVPISETGTDAAVVSRPKFRCVATIEDAHTHSVQGVSCGLPPIKARKSGSDAEAAALSAKDVRPCASGEPHSWKQYDHAFPCTDCGRATTMWCESSYECCGRCCGADTSPDGTGEGGGGPTGPCTDMAGLALVVATASVDKSTALWGVGAHGEDPRMLHRVSLKQPVSTVALVSESSGAAPAWLAGDRSGAVHALDQHFSGSPRFLLKGHTDVIRAVVVIDRPGTDRLTHCGGRGSGACAFVATAARDGSIVVWDCLTGKKVAALKGGHEKAVSGLAAYGDPASAAGDYALVSSDVAKPANIVFWDLSSYTERARIAEAHAKGITALATFSCGGAAAGGETEWFVASGSLDKTVKVWRGTDRTLVHSLAGHRKALTCLAPFDAGLLAAGTGSGGMSSPRIMSVSLDGALMVWDPLAGCEEDSLEWFEGGNLPPGTVTSASVAPDGRCVAFGAEDGALYVYARGVLGVPERDEEEGEDWEDDSHDGELDDGVEEALERGRGSGGGADMLYAGDDY